MPLLSDARPLPVNVGWAPDRGRRPFEVRRGGTLFLIILEMPVIDAAAYADRPDPLGANRLHLVMMPARRIRDVGLPGPRPPIKVELPA